MFVLLLLFIGLRGESASLIAQPGAYSLRAWTIDGGGGPISGADYAIHGSVGQPDAGLLTGGEYLIMGGFWGAAAHSAVMPTAMPTNTPVSATGTPLPSATASRTSTSTATSTGTALASSTPSSTPLSTATSPAVTHTATASATIEIVHVFLPSALKNAAIPEDRP